MDTCGNSQPSKCDTKSLAFPQALNNVACSNLKTDSQKQTGSEE